MIIKYKIIWKTTYSFFLSSVLNVTKRLLVVRQLFEKTLFYFMFMNHYSYNWRQVGGRESLDPVSRFNDPEKDSENFWMMRLAPSRKPSISSLLLVCSCCSSLIHTFDFLMFSEWEWRRVFLSLSLLSVFLGQWTISYTFLYNSYWCCWELTIHFCKLQPPILVIYKVQKSANPNAK